MQEVVYQVFVTVASVIVALLTIGTTGVIILLATNRDTAHTDSHKLTRA